MLIYTKLDANGNLIVDKSKGEKGKSFQKIINIYMLESDPFSWSEEVNKNTNKRDKDFVNAFLSDNGLDFEKLTSIVDWFPYYYVAYLLNICHVIKELGIVELKNQLNNWIEEQTKESSQKGLKMLIDKIPNTIDKNTPVGEISDVFNTFTNLGFLMISLETV